MKTIRAMKTRTTAATRTPGLEIPESTITEIGLIAKVTDPERLKELQDQIQEIGGTYLRRKEQDEAPLDAASRRRLLRAIERLSEALRDALVRIDHETDWQIQRQRRVSAEADLRARTEAVERPPRQHMLQPLEFFATQLEWLRWASAKVLRERGKPGPPPRINEHLLVTDLARVYRYFSNKRPTHHANEGRVYVGKVRTAAGHFILKAAQAIDPNILEREIVTLLPNALRDLEPEVERESGSTGFDDPTTPPTAQED